jgi:UDP-N-acetylmuramoyl-tripeptide--D-alanyl-D-alanine ligase
MHSMSDLWTSEELVAAIGGELNGSFRCNGVAFDSREIGDGDLFFALKGEESDGHNFIDKAFNNGASGAIVNTEISHPHIRVDDTMQALNALAIASRKRCNAKVIGVTGSAGKTGTKEALFAALDRSSRGKAHRSVKSYNNHVGVPLSLSRMPSETQFGIFEMGMNHPGELRDLTQMVRPDVAIITTIAPAHIGFFKDEVEIATAKAEIFEGLTQQGTAIIPADSQHCELLRAKALEFTSNVITFGFSNNADVRVMDHVPSANGGSLVTAKMMHGSLCYTLSQPGQHWIANSLAVLAAVEAVGGDLASAGLALAELPGLDGRGAQHHLIINDVELLVIDESYNANPASMSATLSELGNTQATRRIAVLGSMKELGEKSDYYHAAIATDLVAANVDYVILVGDETKILADNLQSGVEGPRKFDHCSNANEAFIVLRNEIQTGDVILIKGSNSMGLSKIVSELRAEAG